MKTLLLSLVIGITAFTAGWLLKPDRTAAAAAGESKSGAASGTAKSVNPFGAALLSSPAAPGTLQIEPFRSPEEILALMEEMEGTDDDLAVMELLAALPRLMATEVPVIKGMLEKLAGLKSGNRGALEITAAFLAVRWMMQEPEKATEHLLAQSAGKKTSFLDQSETLTAYGILLSAKRNPASAQGLARLLPEDKAKEMQELLVQMEATADPARFLTNITEEKLGTIDDLAPLLARWARTDPAAAAQWAEAHQEEIASAEVKAIAVAWARKDRAAAMAWASGREDRAERYDALVEMAKQAVEGLDQNAAESELAGFPPEVADTVQMDRLGGDGAAPQELLKAMAVKYAGDEEMSGRVADFSRVAVKQMMDKENGTAQAVAWIESLPNGQTRTAATGHLIETWSELDPQAASAWVKALPPGETRETATDRLVDSIRQEDPASALEWAKTLANEDSRRENMRHVFYSWLQKEPGQAIKVLQTLPEAERAGLFKGKE